MQSWAANGAVPTGSQVGARLGTASKALRSCRKPEPRLIRTNALAVLGIGCPDRHALPLTHSRDAENASIVAHASLNTKERRSGNSSTRAAKRFARVVRGTSVSRGTEGLQTRRWREMDSNLRSRGHETWLLPALGFRALAGIAMAGMYMPG